MIWYNHYFLVRLSLRVLKYLEKSGYFLEKDRLVFVEVVHMAIYKAKLPDAQGYVGWSSQENETWRYLLERQMQVVRGRACDEFLQGLSELAMPADQIPQLSFMNQALEKTGWSLVSVSGTVLVDDFFTMLSRRQFPVAQFIRVPEEMDYLKQPDIFHELFGHAPLLMYAEYADFMQWYGEVALTVAPRFRPILSRLFWYTIEFGLMQTAAGLRIYGGGILSSFAETKYALESDEPLHRGFDVEEILKTTYDYQSIQKCYFAIENWGSLYQLRQNKDWERLLSRFREDDQDAFINC